MTTKEILWFDCPICGKPFLSYVYGQYIRICYTLGIHEEGVCFYDNTLGEIHNNSYLHAIKNKRKCRKCRVSHQLEEYII